MHILLIFLSLICWNAILHVKYVVFKLNFYNFQRRSALLRVFLTGNRKVSLFKLIK